MTSEIILGFDWIGPLGGWPNGLSLRYFTDKTLYENSTYSVGNKKKLYDLETHRHPFTHSKLDYVFGDSYTIRQMPVHMLNQKYIYELTPLLKPEQWVDNMFDHVSEKAIADVIQNKSLMVINDMNEGYGNKNTDFFARLHKNLKRKNIPSKNVVYISMNSIMSDIYNELDIPSEERINVFPIYLYEHLYEMGDGNTTKTKHYISLNRSPNNHRLALVYELWKRDLIKYGFVSFPSPDQVLDYKIDRSVLGTYGIDDSRWDEFSTSLPFVVDTSDFTVQDCYNLSIHDYYKQAAFSIISEQTFDEPDCIKFSEKTFMPISNHSLPIFLYSPSSVTTMKNKLGYDTMFSDYDDILDSKERFWKVIDVIETICKQDIKTISELANPVYTKNAKLLKIRHAAGNGKSQFIEFINSWLV